MSAAACELGMQEKRDLLNLFAERRRPHPAKDAGQPLYVLSRDFLVDWRAYIRWVLGSCGVYANRRPLQRPNYLYACNALNISYELQYQQ